MTLAANRRELRRLALNSLEQTDPHKKASEVQMLADEWSSGSLALNSHDQLAPSQPVPGRPPRPELVPPLAVKHRSMRTTEGRAALIHALAHIEFNAINLALDAIWRFPSMPDAFYADWLQVAQEEGRHFQMLCAHLASMGFSYGDFLAHNSLWDMAEKTASDIVARMALVPRTLEARGLDASPALRAKLAQAGDLEAAGILDVILRDEIGHVAIGNRWYAWLCARDGLDPITSFAEFCRQYRAPVMRGPLNLEARRAAGFTDDELQAMLDEMQLVNAK